MSRAFNDLGASMSNSRICFLVKLLHYFLVLIEKEHRGNVPGNVHRESALRLRLAGNPLEISNKASHNLVRRDGRNRDISQAKRATRFSCFTRHAENEVAR